MALSNALVAEFVKATNDGAKDTNKEVIVYGTVMGKTETGDIYVKIDGSEILTPVATTVGVRDNERVTIMIKNHTATITGNISSPSASSRDLNDAVFEVHTLLADKVETKTLNAQVARIDQLTADNVEIHGKLEANEAEIDTLKATDVEITGKLEASEAEIDNLKAHKLDADVADLKYALVEDLEATDAKINNLEGTYGDFVDLTTDKFEATDAEIDDLKATRLTGEQADLKYANIDFSNIGKAALEYIFAQSGLIKDVVIENGTITGNLVGVTIKGSLIEGGTVVADKLVIKGEDGLYYKLNTDGVTTETEQTEYNSINGQIILAKSITADRINVSDLVAFGATIGGFHITDNSLYSGVKESPDNTTRGIYLDSEGQMSIGDSINYVRYYMDENGEYKLDLSIGSIGSVGEAVGDLDNKRTDHEGRIIAMEATLKILQSCIEMLVQDENGASMMTQTPDGGWTFSMANYEERLRGLSGSLDELTGEYGDTKNTVDGLQDAVSALSIFNNYIKITTYEEEPCIELGEYDSDFKLLITNTRILFREGQSTPTYIKDNTFVTDKIKIKSEFSQARMKGDTEVGYFTWAVRDNGNYGLSWKEV